MPWLLKFLSHQQTKYWLCNTRRFLFSLSENFDNFLPFKLEELMIQNVNMYLYILPNNSGHEGLKMHLLKLPTTWIVPAQLMWNNSHAFLVVALYSSTSESLFKCSNSSPSSVANRSKPLWLPKKSPKLNRRLLYLVRLRNFNLPEIETQTN